MIYILEILLLLSPSYIIRFHYGNGSVNLLQILVAAFWLIFAVHLYTRSLFRDFWAFFKNQNKLFLFAALLFLISGIVSAAISPNKTRAVGLLFSYFIQPIITYFLASYLLKHEQQKIKFIKFVYFAVELFAIWGVIQYFTLWGLPKEWWGNAGEPKRIVSFFEYPNALALWISPLLSMILPYSIEANKKKLFGIGVGLAALILTLSRGGLFAFMFSAVVYAFVSARPHVKKIVVGMLAVMLIMFTAIPILRYRIILPFKGEKSAVSRLSLWHTANKMLKESPVLGKGLYGYKSNFDKYNSDPNLASINYPHNIFLNFWVETGLLGLASFIFICAYKLYVSFKNRQSPMYFGIALFILAVVAHGLVDAPYFKNDLALVFWMALAVI